MVRNFGRIQEKVSKYDIIGPRQYMQGLEEQ